MYQIADGILDAKSGVLPVAYMQAARFNAKYGDRFRKKVENWMFSFFYSFGGCEMSKDFRSFVIYLNETYFDEKYDVHSSECGSEPYELDLVREILKTLSALCESCDEKGADENCYLPVKFFMLTCMAREEFLEERVKNRTVAATVTTIGTDMRKRLAEFFVYIKDKSKKICRSDFKEFNSKYMVEQFVSYAVCQFEGLNMEENPTIAPELSHQERRLVPVVKTIDSYDAQIESPSSVRRSKMTPTSPTVNGKRPRTTESRDFEATKRQKLNSVLPSEASMITGGDDEKRRLLTLPELYALPNASAQMEALSKRTASISYYATVALILNYYMSHVYGINLHRSLRYEI